jgi:Tfp pilus assembly protein PilZ
MGNEVCQGLTGLIRKILGVFVFLESQMNKEKNQNNREFTRVPIKVEATLRFEGLTINKVVTQDLSMKGLFVLTEESLPVGSQCEISLSLPDQSDSLKLNLKGVVQRNADAGVGVKFTEIELESYSHLKNLVMLNAAGSNVDSVEREIEGHIGLKKRD